MNNFALTAPRKKSRKAFWFSLHGWFSLPIWGFLAFIFITGTLSVVSQEITWLFNKEIRASNPSQKSSLDYSSLIASVKAKYKGAEIKSIQFTQPYITSLVRIALPDGERKNLHVNQYTGEIQGEMVGIGFRGFILALHGWLLFPWQDNYSVGWYLVTVLSIPLIGSIISGLIVYKHFYRTLLRPKLRLSMGSRVFWGDLHRLIAVWSIWFTIIISISGLWFLVQGVLDQNQIKINPDKIQLQPEDALVSTSNNAKESFSIEDMVSKATEKFPDLRVSYLEFPESTSDTLMIQGKKSFSILRDNVNAINFNPHNGELVASRDSGDLSPLQWMPALLRPLHFGDFAGLISKLIWFLLGCLTSILVCSGFVIWTKRIFQTSPRTKLTGTSSLSKTSKSKSSHQQLIIRQNKIKRAIFWASGLIVFFPLYFLLENNF